MNTNVASKICASVNQKMKDSARQDIALADYRMLDKSHADVLLAYANAIPSLEEIAKFVTVAFKGDAYPVLETARSYKKNKVVGVTLSARQITRPLEDSSKMMAVTASTFIDVNEDAEWEVKTNATTGAKFLARALDEDFESIISAHKASRSNCPFVTALANFESVTAGFLMANENDFVKFFAGTMQCGTIKQVMPDGETVKIINEEGELYVVPKTSILQIIKKDPEEQQQIDKDMESFYAKIWGPAYSADLFKNGSQV